MHDQKDVKVPIKDVIEISLFNHDIEYPDNFISVLRKFYIASLNLGFLEIEDLKKSVDKFTSRISKIVICNSIDELKLFNADQISIINYIKDSYIINEDTLILDNKLLSEDLNKTEMETLECNIYKAISQIIFNAPYDLNTFADVITEITAEKIANMDTNSSRIIMPHSSKLTINKQTITLRAGYTRYNLLINLTKQLFIALRINENVVIRDMMNEDFDSVLKRLNQSDFKKCLGLLNNIYKAYLKVDIFNCEVDDYLELVNNYQVKVNDLFTHIDHNYLAFCALVTSDSLREKLMEKYE